jgi:hypothetical protein
VRRFVGSFTGLGREGEEQGVSRGLEGGYSVKRGHGTRVKTHSNQEASSRPSARQPLAPGRTASCLGKQHEQSASMC